MSEKTEAQLALEVLVKERDQIYSFERLRINPDFQRYMQEIEKRRESLRDLLEVAKDEELSTIRGQIQAIKGMRDLFDTTLNRREAVVERIKELENA